MVKTNKNKKEQLRILLTYIIVLVMGCFVIGGFIKVQLIDGRRWRETAEKYEADEFVEEARRGNIYSADGKIMATTIPICDLYVDFGTRKKIDKMGRVVKDSTGADVMVPMISDSTYRKTIDLVCGILAELDRPGKDALYYKNRLNTEKAKDKPSRCFLVEKNIPYSTWDRIVHLDEWSSFVVKRMGDGESVIKQRRAHIYGNLAENCIGFGISQIELATGLEGYYNKRLAGQDGLYECRRLSRGVWLPVSAADGEQQSAADTLTKDMQKRERIDGDDIISTIDTRYQDIAETALRRSLHRYGGNEQSSGCVVLMEAKTGYVLACCNLAWDSLYREIPDRNIACSDLYSPGSTFKTVVITAMMNDPTVDIDTAMRIRVAYKKFNGRADGEISDDHFEYKDKARTVRVDTMSLKHALAISSNVGVCELVWQNYRDRRNDIRRQVEKIFPYEVLNLDIRAGESASKLNDFGPDRDFLAFCFGYAQSISAMQMVTFYNALANGGRMVKPQFCRAILSNGIRHDVAPIVLKESICNEKTLKIMNELLVNVVENGTGSNIKDNSYGIAGKTGTSKNSKVEGRRSASFVGYFPAENPTYTCIVVVKDVLAYGSSAAAPVFKKVADCVVALDKNLENGKIEVGSNSGINWLAAKHSPKMDSYTDGVVPDCKGMTAKEAVSVLNTVGLTVELSGRGRVVRQSIAKGTRVKKGTKIHITLNTLDS